MLFPLVLWFALVYLNTAAVIFRPPYYEIASERGSRFNELLKNHNVLPLKSSYDDELNKGYQSTNENIGKPIMGDSFMRFGRQANAVMHLIGNSASNIGKFAQAARKPRIQLLSLMAPLKENNVADDDDKQNRYVRNNKDINDLNSKIFKLSNDFMRLGKRFITTDKNDSSEIFNENEELDEIKEHVLQEIFRLMLQLHNDVD